MHPKRTFIGWKPLVWFVKGEPKKDYLPEYVPDIILSPKADKNLDQWDTRLAFVKRCHQAW
jgi:hypothetical protein